MLKAATKTCLVVSLIFVASVDSCERTTVQPWCKDVVTEFKRLPPEVGAALQVHAHTGRGHAQLDCFWSRPTLTGDWLGLRPCLQDCGVTFRGNVTQFAFGIDGASIHRFRHHLGKVAKLWQLLGKRTTSSK